MWRKKNIQREYLLLFCKSRAKTWWIVSFRKRSLESLHIPSRAMRSGVAQERKKQNNKTWRVGERERWWASIARRLISWIFLLLNFDASQRGKFSNYISFSFTFSSTFWVPNWEVDFAFCDFFSDGFFSSHSLLDERATDGGEKEARTSGMRL